MDMFTGLILVSAVLTSLTLADSGSEYPGHHKPFGYGATKQVEEVDGFIPVKEFFSSKFLGSAHQLNSHV